MWPCWNTDFGLWHPELWQNKFMCFKVLRFVVLCCSSPRNNNIKWIDWMLYYKCYDRRRLSYSVRMDRKVPNKVGVKLSLLSFLKKKKTLPLASWVMLGTSLKLCGLQLSFSVKWRIGLRDQFLRFMSAWKLGESVTITGKGEGREKGGGEGSKRLVNSRKDLRLSTESIYSNRDVHKPKYIFC